MERPFSVAEQGCERRPLFLGEAICERLTESAGRCPAEFQASTSLRRDLDDDFAAFSPQVDEAMVRELTSASLRRLTTHLEESCEIGDVHRADLADGFEGAVLSERHPHAVEGLIHEHLELMLAAAEHDHEFPRTRMR